ncbi:MAG: outer membrane protein assembly factor BamA [Rhodobiaceae bacterium]|nr:outer membrane protein assembly factor BamA [Rhodobiaceae bacterium]MCC0052724.1 outer membrane protein assembly factor BamA [Rhodobiaceae bacterium]
MQVVGAQFAAAAARFVTTCLMLLALVAGAVSLSPASAAAQTISAIDVEGNRRVDDDTVRSYVTISPGQRYSEYAASESVKALFQTGLFEDVTIGMRSTRLVVTVVEAALINRVVFEGNKRLEDAVLAAEIESQPRGMLTRAKVQRDTQRLLQLYRAIGRFGARVEPKIIDLPDNRVNLVFEIDESEKTSIARINFVGNVAFSDPQLRDVITSRQQSWLSWLKTTDIYSPERLEVDQEMLRRHYLKNGYADFRVISAVADLDRERNVFYITITVEEGERYSFGMVEVESNVPDVDPESLRGIVMTREGRIYNAELVEKTTEELTIELAKSGYAFAQVRPRGDRDAASLTIGITYVIDEGQRAYVERINIRGNTRTLDSVIRREFDFAEGDPYNRVLVDRARRRLVALQYFEKVSITNEPGSSPDRVIVNVDVIEQPTGEFSVGAGYSTASGVMASLSIGERNFLGRGQKVNFAVGVGESKQTYEFGFTEPYFMGRRLSAGFDVYSREYKKSDNYDYNRSDLGGNIRFGLPLNENLRLNLTYQLFQREITDPGPTASTVIVSSVGTYLYSIGGYEFVYSTLDNPVRPRNGVIAKFGQDLAGLGGDVHYISTEASISHFHEIRPRLVSMLQAKGRYITGWDGDAVLPMDAGLSTIRGFESMGPRDATSGDALGGKFYAQATAELQFPLPVLPQDLGFSAAVFAEAAVLTGSDATGITLQDDSSIRSSAGFSILWDSPFGLLRGDVGFPITKEDYDKTQLFHFGAGTRF